MLLHVLLIVLNLDLRILSTVDLLLIVVADIQTRDKENMLGPKFNIAK